jgi:rhodanese-related sulfurtransferase
MIMQTISRAELQNEIAAGNVVVLEALPANYYADGHIPGALNMPLDDVDALAATLVPDRTTPVVTYCTGASCPNSRIAAEHLRKLGYTNVRAFEEGKQGWTEAGLPLESAAIA